MTDAGHERSSVPRWHQALVYALDGRRRPQLGSQPTPDLAFLAGWLRSEGVEPQDRAYVVPSDLLAGIGPAQFWAVLSRLQAELRTSAAAVPSPVLADRPLTAEERRLVTDVPPHHGS